MSILFAHLESIRHFTKNLTLYQRNAQSLMSDSGSRLDELLEDAFRFVLLQFLSTLKSMYIKTKVGVFVDIFVRDSHERWEIGGKLC